MSAAAEPFDVCGPLPTGVTVLEASAGTGKTFTIAALAARYVAAGTPLEHLLLVTFTRAATGELRDRVRERLVSAEAGLARVRSGGHLPEGDDVLAQLADGSDDEVAERHRRLTTALADFDAATIATTHGFCKHVLGGLGVSGDVERDVEFLEDPGDLVEEVVDDLYVRRFHHDDRAPPITRSEALRIARLVVANPDALIEPRHAPSETVPAMRWRLASAVRDELDARKRRAGLITYEDLLTRLADTLADQRRGPAARRRLRDRYRVALVDEFQDTDPVQWQILQRVFGADDATLVLIGDPKQAIFAFRGADVYAYLAAAQAAGHRATLATNWRSDQGLLDAYDALFGDAVLGHEGIPYRRARSAGAHRTSRLAGAPVAAPLRVRVVRRDDGLVRLTDTGYVSAPPGRELVAADLAADVARLLSSDARVITRRADGSERRREPVRPGHVAVLVARNRDAALVQRTLEAAGIPAVINGVGSVFATPAAQHWLRLLEALERPASPARARLVALSAFLGWSAGRIAAADEADWEQVHAQLHDWADVLRKRGVASLFETITVTERLPGRLLARAEGERDLTDLRHLAELLHAAAAGESLGATALSVWLRQRVAEAAGDAETEERSRRLESDAEAVQVITVHRSKGLEFPVVYCPYLWSPAWIPKDADPVYHDPDEGDRRTVDVGGRRSPGYHRRWKRHKDEQRGEELRLAYVALTRARHQAVIWWAAAYDSGESPLCRLLFQRDGAPDQGRARPPDDVEAVETLGELAGRAPGCVSVEVVTGETADSWQHERAPSAGLAAARFDRRLDRWWGRTSYSGIVARSEQARVGSEPGEDVVADEAMGPGAGSVAAARPGEDETRLRAAASPLAAMPGGAAVGSFVHAVLEHSDYAAADLGAELAARVAEQQARHHVDVGDPGVVAAGLRAALETPLGPIVGDLRLRDVARRDRLDELWFELPLAGGDEPAGALEPGAVADLLRAHLPAGDPLGGYADRLGDPALHGLLRGYLAGSIDLVLRVHPAGGAARFVVVDHKTNWLGVDGEALSAWHYRPSALAEAMQRGHYPLQALLYLAALHRYLRWRLPGYDPERNLGGVLYLFVRGMTGPDNPRVGDDPCGVFGWRPPVGLVAALSDLLDRGTVAA